VPTGLGLLLDLGTGVGVIHFPVHKKMSVWGMAFVRSGKFIEGCTPLINSPDVKYLLTF
jgi:hypothetical protein